MTRPAAAPVLEAGQAQRHLRHAGGLEHGQETAVRRQLEKILSSPFFCGSRRMQRFLAMVVNESLAGRAERIKEYTIGVEAFERPETFSPVADPIVRVEARRLREKLTHYYEQYGRSDEVVIEVPRGQYLPCFSFRPDQDELRCSEAALTIHPFVANGERAQAVREALIYELVDQLVRIRRVPVMTGTGAVYSGLALTGCIQMLPKGIRVVAQLKRAPQFLCEWSTAVNRSSSTGLAKSIAAAIAGRVAEHLSRAGLSLDTAGVRRAC